MDPQLSLHSIQRYAPQSQPYLYFILSFRAQDGLLRVFHYDSMELVGVARSYFGGLLCAAWSPDGKYIVAGGEDDLVTVYRFDSCVRLLSVL